MQATGTLREARFSKSFILVVVAMLCALLLGAAGGYLARSGGQSAGTGTHVQQKVDAIQGGPDSDLTRALPTAAPADPAAGYDVGQTTGSNEPQPDHGFIP
jgi:hypothetical protein